MSRPGLEAESAQHQSADEWDAVLCEGDSNSLGRGILCFAGDQRSHAQFTSNPAALKTMIAFERYCYFIFI